jgi:hypothetical protein
MFEQAFKNIEDVFWKEAGLHHRDPLHRADLLAAFPEIPGQRPSVPYIQSS